MGCRKVLAMALFLFLSACGDENKGKSLGAPQIEPPVTNNMPSGFSSQSLQLTMDDSSPIAALKAFLFPTNDFNGPLQRLESIDERMASLDRRAQETARKCMDNTASTWEVDGLPADESYVQKYQCLENLNESSQLAFGLDESNFYLVERNASEGDERLVYATTTRSGSESEVWEISFRAEGTELLHIKGSDTDSGVEIAKGSSANGSVDATSCSFRIKSNADYIYFSGSLRLAGEANCGESSAVCYKADDLSSAETSNCEEAGLTSFSFNEITIAEAGSLADAVKAAIEKPITGFEDFNN